MTKHEQACDYLNQLEDHLIKVEKDKEPITKSKWLLLARILYFLLDDYCRKTR